MDKTLMQEYWRLSPSKKVGTTEFYQKVPKALEANMNYRRNIIKWAGEKPENATMVWRMCKRDLLFFINTFCWTFDPRNIGAPVTPFITWFFQDVSLRGMAGWILEQRHGTVKKTRDMGMTWMAVLLSAWLWLFYDDLAILFASRKADYVDKTGDPRTIFWKIDFVVDWLPGFLKPPAANRKGEDARTHMLCRNFHTGSVISGESTNEDLSRGDRRTVIWLDEFASVSDASAVMAAALDASGCVIPFSTPKGAMTEFASLNNNVSWEYILLKWVCHPAKAGGLYKVDKDGEIEVIDKEWHAKNPGYKFRSEPGLSDGYRSPWYDVQWDTRSRVQLAQEVDADDAAAGAQFFDPVKITSLVDKFAAEPVAVGELIFDTESYSPKKIFERKGGFLFFWKKYSENKPEPGVGYSIGVDVAVGTGASNTVFCIINRKTKEQEAEFVCSTIRPVAAAEYLVPLAKWFNDAFIVPEANGPGRELVDRVIEIGYLNIMFRRKEESLSKKTSDTAGWYSTASTKRSLLAEYGRALEAGELKIYSRESLEECNSYVVTTNGVEHDKSLSNVKTDPSGAKSNHGDRVIAAALAWHGVNMFSEPEEKKGEEYAPGTVGYRFMQRQRERERVDSLEGMY